MLGYHTITHSTPEIDLGPHKEAILNLYFTFLIVGGHVGLPLLIVTVVFIRRHPTLVNFLILWTVYATACLILLYSGEQRMTDPNFDICLVQASMIYGSIAGGTTATFCLVLQLWIEFRCRKFCRNSRLSTTLLLLAPWVFFSFFVILAVVIGVKDPSIVTNKWVFYCTVSSNYIVYSVSAVGLVMVALVLIFQASVHRFLYKAGQFRAVNQSSFRLSLRVSIFSFCSAIAFTVEIVVAFKPTAPAAYLVFSLLPLSIFLVFGTQKENLRMWFRLRRKPKGHVCLEPMSFKEPTTQSSDPATSTAKEFDTNKSLPLTPRTVNAGEHA